MLTQRESDDAATASRAAQGRAGEPYDALRRRHLLAMRARLAPALERLDWSAERLQAYRQARLCELLHFAKERSAWHRQRLAHIDADTLTESGLVDIPPMTKHDVMAHFDQISTDPRVTLEVAEAHLAALTGDAYLYDRYHVNASGGSTGRRGVMVTDWDGWSDGFISLLRGLRRLQQHDPATRTEGRVPIGAVVAAMDPLHMSTAMPQTFDDPGSTEWHRFPVNLPFEQIVAGLAASQPDFIVGYPSVLHQLALVALDGSLTIAPRVIVSASEPLTPVARATIERAWSARLINWWVTTEAAGIAMSCGCGRGMHLCDDNLIVEPVDVKGRAVRPGVRAAKVYVTNLFNRSPLPLIRYEITDQVTVLDAKCPCGSAHRLIDDVQGRLEDIFHYGALTIHPVLFCTPLERASQVTEYQVRQTPHGAAVAVCASGPLDLDGVRREIADNLSGAGLCSPEVTVTRMASIERQRAGKLRRFVALRSR